MLFNCFEFILFGVSVVVIYYLISDNKWRKIFLLVASYYFYACWNVAFLAILLFETLLSYTVPRLFKGGGGSSKRDRNLFVGAGILLLMPLFCFKYLNCLLHFWLSSYLLEFWAVGSLFILHFKLQEEYERME